jgi:cytochrome c oxidase subunit 2
VRPATAVAGALVAAAAGMTALALAAGDEGSPAAARTATPARTAAAEESAAPARRGLAVWVANGCGSCHTFAPANAKGVLGPDLAATLQGTGAAYIRESIVDPSAVAAPNWDAGMMPTDFAKRIPPADLEKLVAFIERGVDR